jgi:type IV secretory pathway protease TraF
MKRHLIPLALGLTACAALTRASAPSLIWNTTASAPIGLYRVLSPRPMRRGDLVAIAPPPALANALARRGVLPLGVPLIKPVAGLPGDLVCRHRRTITVAGRTLASARLRDSRAQYQAELEQMRKDMHQRSPWLIPMDSLLQKCGIDMLD